MAGIGCSVQHLLLCRCPIFRFLILLLCSAHTIAAWCAVHCVQVLEVQQVIMGMGDCMACLNMSLFSMCTGDCRVVCCAGAGSAAALQQASEQHRLHGDGRAAAQPACSDSSAQVPQSGG